MTSTFHGLEVAKRGMSTQQAALYTTGQNIANANTPGYSRQRVNFEQTEPYPAPSMNRPEIPGQMGTGVKAGSIQRVRENFLDLQYRDEQNKVGYWSARSDALTKMEDILKEPSDSGLAKTMDDFWKGLQTLSTNPENSGARSVVLSNGKAVTETFHYLNDSLTALQKDLSNQTSVTVKEVNSLAQQIASINKQISEIEPHGYLPNDLYDERDRLVDQLTELVNVKVEMTPSTTGTSNALKIAEGIANIKLVGADGQELKDGSGNPIYLVKGDQPSTVSFTGGSSSTGGSVLDVPPEDGVTDMVITDSTGATSTISFKDELGSGKLRGLIESFGYKEKDATTGAYGETKGIYPEMLDKLDQLAYTFATMFNDVHKQGYQLNSDQPGGDFFSGLGADYHGAAKAIDVALTDGSQIAASTEKNTAGNGLNAIKLAGVRSTSLTSTSPTPIKTGTVSSFYEAMIGQLGVEGQQASRMLGNADTLRQSVDGRRQSVSAVSLDEEMTNMIQFQHAYNAAARNITVVDEMLDKIINGMGLVGR
ncbi:flagellar hook-associated protein FlgK [Priestia koreensis]|uniref:flagellar hook-associated protein FlgK n=1 Tax=Priestia koreensis TaxID=284581 RepID=UPI003459D6A8